MEFEKERFRVEPSRLVGEVTLSGAKNSTLRLLAASLLTKEAIRIYNYPSKLSDCCIHVEMLKLLGKECIVDEDSIVIKEPTSLISELRWKGRSIRNTLLILGALTARNGKGRVPLPGGCKLGERKYDLHEMVLRRLGAEVWSEDNFLCAEVKGRLKGAEIFLPIRSTGATENAILCGSLAEGTTRVWNPHIRPEIIDLITMLKSMGADITVYGQEHICISGSEMLSGANHRVIPDNMEGMTWLIASVITNGDIEIKDFPFAHLEVPLIHLRESGACFYRGGNSLIVRKSHCYPIDISTGPYPGINSDMQPLFAVYGFCAKGESRITDLRFPGRYGYASEIEKMGGVYSVDGGMLRILGKEKLQGAQVEALDLRSGAALALAGLVAEGQTVIDKSWQITRGYNDFITKLRQLDGKIERV